MTNDNTDTGDLIKILRYYDQNGKTVFGEEQTDATIAAQKAKYSENNYFSTLGGLKRMGYAFANKMVLVLSLWDDRSANMLWLDSTYPTTSSLPGAIRGSCPTNSGIPSVTREIYPSSQVIYSNIQVNKIGSSGPPVVPPANCQSAYAQCGGSTWLGSTCCISGYTCTFSNQYYSQCLPSSTPPPPPPPPPSPTGYYKCSDCTFVSQ